MDSGFACKEGHGTKSSLATAPSVVLPLQISFLFHFCVYVYLHPTLVLLYYCNLKYSRNI